MQVINCEQGTAEWLNARLGIATASNFSKIITTKGEVSKSIKDLAFDLVSQTISNIQDESYKNADMQRGNDLEPEARQLYKERTLSDVKELGFIKCDYYGYSPDGLVGEDGIIEIKCPKQNTHTKYLFNNSLPSIYKAQVQGGLLVTGREWCDFISYHPNFRDDKKMLIVRVFRDDEYINSLSKYLLKLKEYKEDILSKINKNGVQ